MATFRVYINNEVIRRYNDKDELVHEEGGDHVRFVDIEAGSVSQARENLAASDDRLQEGEEIGDITQVVLDRRGGW